MSSRPEPRACRTAVPPPPAGEARVDQFGLEPIIRDGGTASAVAAGARGIDGTGERPIPEE